MLRPSVLEAIIRLQKAVATSETQSLRDAMRISLSTYANAGYDFDSAQLIYELFPVLPDDHAKAYRIILSHLLAELRPAWLELLKRGREVMLDALDMDSRSCFHRAGALDLHPSEEVTAWLDSFASQAFARHDANKLALGRTAERLSIDYERARLEKEECLEEIVWVSLDDNGAGYDVRSATLVEGGYQPKLIEVNPPIPAQIVYGRSYNGGNRGPLCQRNSEAEALSAVGLPIYPNLCSVKGVTGTIVRCPHFGNCAYLINQKIQGQCNIVFYVESHLPA